jgi:hypothetical protein
MNSSLTSFAEYMQGYRITELFPRKGQNSGRQSQNCCPQLRRRIPEVRILRSGNGMFRSTKAMLRSEKGSFRLFFAISNEKTGVIPFRNENVAMKNRNVAIDNGQVEVGDRNVAETEEKFHSLLIKNPKDVSYKLSKGRKVFSEKATCVFLQCRNKIVIYSRK